MAPVFSHGDLRLYLLSLLDESPRHGYDLMQALADRTGGTYTPSAGTIYPRLAKLEEEGLVTKTVDGRKTIYALTDAGRTEVAARAGELEGIQSDLADSVRLIAQEVRGSVRERAIRRGDGRTPGPFGIRKRPAVHGASSEARRPGGGAPWKPTRKSAAAAPVESISSRSGSAVNTVS